MRLALLVIVGQSKLSRKLIALVVCLLTVP